MDAKTDGHKGPRHNVRGKKMRPLIGITCSRILGGAWGEYSPGHYMDYIYIEAVEHPSKRFILGVQWHPEGTWKNDLYSKKLSRAFVQASLHSVKRK